MFGQSGSVVTRCVYDWTFVIVLAIILVVLGIVLAVFFSKGKRKKSFLSNKWFWISLGILGLLVFVFFYWAYILWFLIIVIVLYILYRIFGARVRIG